MCVRGICCEGEHSVQGGVRQRYRSRQGGLSCFERGDSGGRPLQCLGGPSECICEWHVLLERPYAVLVHPVAQEFDSGGIEHALRWVDLQAILLKDGEDLPEMLVMLLQRVAGNDEVFQVAEHKRQVLE